MKDLFQILDNPENFKDNLKLELRDEVKSQILNDPQLLQQAKQFSKDRRDEYSQRYPSKRQFKKRYNK